MFEQDDNYGNMPEEEEIIVNEVEEGEGEEPISYYKPDVVYGDDDNDNDDEVEPYRAAPINNDTNTDYRETTVVEDYDMEPTYDQDFDVSNTNFGKSTVNDILASQKVKSFGSSLRKNQNGLFDMPKPGQKGFAGIAIVSVLIALIGLVICYFAFRI